jgi:uncharacterized membrane protein YqhA
VVLAVKLDMANALGHVQHPQLPAKLLPLRVSLLAVHLLKRVVIPIYSTDQLMLPRISALRFTGHVEHLLPWKHV